MSDLEQRIKDLETQVEDLQVYAGLVEKVMQTAALAAHWRAMADRLEADHAAAVAAWLPDGFDIFAGPRTGDGG